MGSASMYRRSSTNCCLLVLPLPPSLRSPACCASAALRKRSCSGPLRVHRGSSGGLAGPSPAGDSRVWLPEVRQRPLASLLWTPPPWILQQFHRCGYRVKAVQPT